MAKEIDLLERQRRLAWYLIVPAVFVVFLVIGYPLIQVLVYSVLKYKLDGVTPASFVGFGNYLFILTDSDFWRAVQNTLIFSVFSVTLECVLGLAVALVANSKFKGRSILRVAILIPWAIPTVVSSKIWAWMFNDIYGVVNVILINLHLIPQKIAFLATPATALPVIIAVDVWKTTPFMALLLLAGLGLIPGDLYEAASIDGATKVRQFFSLTLHWSCRHCWWRLSSVPWTRCASSTSFMSWLEAKEIWRPWPSTISKWQFRSWMPASAPRRRSLFS